MMNFIEIAKKRYSVRNYSSKKVEKEKLDKILQAAHVAPTAANLQPVHLIAVESKEGLEKISKGANVANSRWVIETNSPFRCTVLSFRRSSNPGKTRVLQG